MTTPEPKAFVKAGTFERVLTAFRAATGITEIGDVFHIDRGYDDIVGRLSALGASISRVQADS